MCGETQQRSTGPHLFQLYRMGTVGQMGTGEQIHLDWTSVNKTNCSVHLSPGLQHRSTTREVADLWCSCALWTMGWLITKPVQLFYPTPMVQAASPKSFQLSCPAPTAPVAPRNSQKPVHSVQPFCPVPKAPPTSGKPLQLFCPPVPRTASKNPLCNLNPLCSKNPLSMTAFELIQLIPPVHVYEGVGQQAIPLQKRRMPLPPAHLLQTVEDMMLMLLLQRVGRQLRMPLRPMLPSGRRKQP